MVQQAPSALQNSAPPVPGLSPSATRADVSAPPVPSPAALSLMPVPQEQKAANSRTRLNLANERTLLSWARLACIFAAGGYLASILVPKVEAGGSALPPAVLAQLLLGGVVATLGLKVYSDRRRMLDHKWHGSYALSVAPWVAIVGIWATLALTLIEAISKETEYSAPDCLRLSLPLGTSPPPYLYVSFHGSLDPLGNLCTGTGAVQRFALDGTYVGPATDQRAALVHSPRMLTFHNELLVVADAGEGEEFHRPALAVFGDCAGVDIRPFLGRVRARDPLVEQSFTHPYGLATAPSGLLHATGQRGGALLAVDMSNASMRVLSQLEPAGEAGGNLLSGPLRGVAVDKSGCSHVADKHADVIWHVCPGRPTRSTKLTKPVGISIDGGLLYVGSFGQSKPAVVVLRLDDDQKSAEVVRTIRHPRLVHPAGLLVYNDVLYVLEQSAQALLSFDAASGDFVQVLVEGLPDLPEGLLLSPGC